MPPPPTLRRGRDVLVTGASGQDAAFLIRDLLHAGDKVTGVCRSCTRSPSTLWRLSTLGVVDHPHLDLVAADLADAPTVAELVERTQPSEVYHLAAESNVPRSDAFPLDAVQSNVVASVNLLEAVRASAPRARTFIASSSEVFGDAAASPQHERHPYRPRNMYGATKAFTHSLATHYRENHGLFVANGILFNHESALRDPAFVTRKITRYAANARNARDPLHLGNLDTLRDWGYAPDYVRGMQAMLEAPVASDYVLATGVARNVRTLAEQAFEAAGVTLAFEGSGFDEVGYDINTGRVLVCVDPSFWRPSESVPLIGDPGKAFRDLGWAASTPMHVWIETMVEADRGHPNLAHPKVRIMQYSSG